MIWMPTFCLSEIFPPCFATRPAPADRSADAEAEHGADVHDDEEGARHGQAGKERRWKIRESIE